MIFLSIVLQVLPQSYKSFSHESHARGKRARNSRPKFLSNLKNDLPFRVTFLPSGLRLNFILVLFSSFCACCQSKHRRSQYVQLFCGTLSYSTALYRSS